MKIKTHLRTLYAIVVVSMILTLGTGYKYHQDTQEYIRNIDRGLFVIYNKVDSVHQDVRSIAFWTTFNKESN